MLTTLTTKGQITIPIAIREFFGLKPADKLVFTVKGEKILATPVKSDIMDIYGSVRPRGRGRKGPVDLDAVRKRVRKKMAYKIAREGR